MQYFHHYLHRIQIAAGLLTLLFAASATAQTNEVRFQLPGGGDGGSVPTKDGESITWDSEGNLMVTCADAEPDGFCDGSVGKSSGSGVGAATLDYLRFNGGATDLTIQPTDSLAVTVEWGADSSTDVCLSSLSITPTGDPAATPATWSEKLGRTGSKAFTQLGASSTNDIQYDFTMTCYNESGSDTATGTRTISATVKQREIATGENACNIVKGVGVAGTDPNFQPAGYTRRDITWSKAFSYPPSGITYEFPDTSSTMYPIGSWTLGDLSIKGQYITIPFVADDFPNATAYHKLEWYKAVAKTAFPAYKPHPANGVFITISPCAGDFRTSGNLFYPPGDETLNKFCRVYHQESNMTFGENGACPTEPGTTYYLNIMFDNPVDGLDPTQTSCDPNGYQYFSGRCDAMFQIR